MCSVNKKLFVKTEDLLVTVKLFGYINEYNSVQDILIEMLVFLSVYDNKFLCMPFNFC